MKTIKNNKYKRMKTISIKLLLVILMFNLSSCKKESPTFSDYQFAEEEQVISCTEVNNKLLNEAIYSFEKDITPYFDKQLQNTNRAYNTFIKQATNKRVDFAKFTSKHSVEIAKALKEAGFIRANGVNYKNPLIHCIGENMKKDDLKTTFNALISTNSMNRALFTPALQTKSHVVYGDKYLSLYVILEYYYADVLKIDFTNVNFDRAKETEPANPIKATSPNAKVDFNKRPAKQ
ncbi:hypothetical protein [Lacinutrix himadriensis]|jgi:hypothetical protein|uniref:hypothetical protein n=1 Tax=Lacinutrix himadriensis TaxID=641549 RepID=UPI0006E39B62|nr:hypothetical protein [Lacinutrix himadriensis]